MKKSTILITLVLTLFSTSLFAQKIEKSAKIGAGIYEIVHNSKDNTIYIASTGKRGTTGTARIYKLDAGTLEVKSEINVSEAPAYGLGINTTTQTLYSSNTRSNSVSAIDLKSGKVIATIKHGKESSHTREVAVDESKNLVYVSNLTDIWVIDGKTNKFSHLIDTVGEGVTGLALDTKGQLLYTTNMSKDSVTVYDLKAKKTVKTFPSGGKNAINIVFDAKGKRLFVANQGSGTVTVLNTKGELLHSIETGAGALGINFNPVKNKIYVANRGAGTTSIIDGKTYKVVSSLKTGTHPQTIAVDKKTGKVFVTNKAQGRPRPVAGQPAPPEPPDDPNGDTVVIIAP